MSTDNSADKKDDYSFEDAIGDAIKTRREQLDTTAPKTEAPKDTRPAAKSPEELKERVIEALETVYDPEIPVNLYALGLIYNIEIDTNGTVDITMTLTAPNCPVAGEIPRQVEEAALGVNGITEAKAHLVWDPPWDKSMMSEEAELELGMF